MSYVDLYSELLMCEVFYDFIFNCICIIIMYWLVFFDFVDWIIVMCDGFIVDVGLGEEFVSCDEIYCSFFV